jgi:hypothetical protein
MVTVQISNISQMQLQHDVKRGIDAEYILCSAALLSAMYVSDKYLKGPQLPTSPPIHGRQKSFLLSLGGKLEQG